MQRQTGVLLIFVIVAQLLLIPFVYGQAGCDTGEWRIDGECTALDTVLDAGWHRIDPAGDTRCAHDTEYTFWVRPGNDDVLLYFQGGGGCWDQSSCRIGSSFYKQRVSPLEPRTYRNGIFDFNNPDNPFADHTIIFAPSCTGDVYMGSGVVDYGDDVVVHHRGFDNLMAAVNFTIDYAPEPASVFVTGCSAGSVGSAVATPHIIDAYPDTRVTQLGDSLGLIFRLPNDFTSFWGIRDFYTPTLTEFAPDYSAFSMTDYYHGLGQAYPDHTFAQFNYQYDNVQQRYFAIGQADPRQFVGENLPIVIQDIADSTPNFRYYIDEGDSHCILPSADLYRAEVNGVPALDWITSIALGEPVDNLP